MMRKNLTTLLWVGALSAMTSVHANAPFSASETADVDYLRSEQEPARECESLIAVSDYRHTVISAVSVPATGDVPGHCRVSGLIPQEVRFEVNLPDAWNGRLYMYGNGGMAGTPADNPGKRASAAAALRRGFATAYTDTGHDARVERGGTFAHNNFNKLVDYGFRAVHLTAVSAKTLAAEYFGSGPDYSYFHGCSTGGRQAMIAAQRFPDDFDGILAGAPAADYSGLKFSQAWRVSAITEGGFTPEEVADLAGHIYARCDALDGLKDGLLDDPQNCPFSIDDLPRCRGKDRTDCYTDQELTALQTYYSPVVLAGETVYPPMPVGSEVPGPVGGGQQAPGWVPWLINPNGPVLLDLLGSDFFRYMAYVKDDPSFEWTEFDFTEAPDNLAEFQAIVDAVNPDLSAFEQGGGRLISYFGWADPDINPQTAIDYRAAVDAGDNSGSVDDYYRLFLVPGMFHCRRGPGPDQFDAMTPLIEWVEAGTAPTRIPAWHEEDGERSGERPLCAWPARAHATSPDADQLSDFECR